MKILVLSDCHYKKFLVDKTIRHNLDAELIVFLGDGQDNIRDIPLQYPMKAFVGLRGNCDFCSPYPLTQSFQLDQINFFCTHGHLYHVKSTLAALKKEAKDAHAHVALFGHTHMQLLEELPDLLLMNPGSLSNGDYGLIDTSGGTPHAFLCHED